MGPKHKTLVMKKARLCEGPITWDRSIINFPELCQGLQPPHPPRKLLGGLIYSYRYSKTGSLLLLGIRNGDIRVDSTL
jgi:hypothetical protein